MNKRYSSILNKIIAQSNFSIEFCSWNSSVIFKKIYKFAYIFIFNTYKVFVIWHCCFTIPGELTSSNSRCITNQLTAILSPINLDLKHSRFKETVTQSQRQNPREKIILSCSLRAKIITYLAKNKFSRKKYIFSSIRISLSSFLQENCYLL